MKFLVEAYVERILPAVPSFGEVLILGALVEAKNEEEGYRIFLGKNPGPMGVLGELKQPAQIRPGVRLVRVHIRPLSSLEKVGSLDDLVEFIRSIEG